MIAVGSGKLTGKGLGQGIQSHLRFLPERQTDFIFASFAEEFGFIGSILMLSLYATLVGTLLRTAHDARKQTEKLTYGCYDRILKQVHHHKQKAAKASDALAARLSLEKSKVRSVAFRPCLTTGLALSLD